MDCNGISNGLQSVTRIGQCEFNGLTTALHRNVSRLSVELSRLSASGERERYTASSTGAGSSLKITDGCLSFERHLELSRSLLAYTVQSFLHSIGLDLESNV